MEKEIIELKCECGTNFSRTKIPENWMKLLYYRWKFKYCDICLKKKEEEAMRNLPKILNGLANATI